MNLPGKPDISLPKYKTAVFVHGCFWHHHKGCKRANWPKSNKKYWVPKIEHNILRDKTHARQLRRIGWRAVTIWECQTRQQEKILKKITRLIEKQG